jgi:hypothetical protein
MLKLPRALRYIWLHRTVALILAVGWNVLMYLVWSAEAIPSNVPPWLPLIFAAVFAVLVPVSFFTSRHKPHE